MFFFKIASVFCFVLSSSFLPGQSLITMAINICIYEKIVINRRCNKHLLNGMKK